MAGRARRSVLGASSPLDAFRRTAPTDGSPGGDARRGPTPALGALVAGAVVLFVGLPVAVGIAHGFDKTSGGEVAVVRNGGPLDNNRVRQVIPPASAITWRGLWSTSHKYPAQQRFYTITADASRGDRTGVDVEHDPTADGVEVGIEGTIYFTLNTSQDTLRTFDDRYGTRKYRGLDGEYRYAWESDEGWSTFLDQIVRPVISNDLREQIGSFRCAELISSCALVQNVGAGAGQQQPAAAKGGNATIAKIQESVNQSLADDLQRTLGGDFITGVRFNLVRITLPKEVQDAVNKAQAAFAQVTEAQAKIAQARAEAQANEQRQRGYQSCPACATIDQLKAIPPNVTTFAPGAGFAVTPQGK